MMSEVDMALDGEEPALLDQPTDQEASLTEVQLVEAESTAEGQNDQVEYIRSSPAEQPTDIPDIICHPDNNGTEEDTTGIDIDADRPSGQLVKDLESLFSGKDDDEDEADADIEGLQARVLQLEKDRGQLTAEVMEKDESLSQLERQVASLKAELSQNAEAHESALEASERKWKHLHEETSAKISELKKQFAAANRDKEAMVMKYALGEKDIIVQKKTREEAEKKMKAAVKDKDDAVSKMKAMTAERNKALQLADSRLQDVTVMKKDLERWKEEVRIQEAKVTLNATRLKTESDAHKETRAQLDQTIKHLTETRSEIESTRKECADFMAKISEEEERKKEKEKESEQAQSAKLIIDAAAANELETVRDKYQKVIDENNTLSQKIQTSERERLENEAAMARLKETVEAQKREIVDLLAQVAEMESLRLQLQRQEERYEASSAEVDRLRAEASELNADMMACRKKEAELLEFTQKLTDKNVTLQSDLATAEAKSSAIETEHTKLASRVGDLETSRSQTAIELDEEKKKRESETALLVKKLAEKSRQVDVLNQQALDAQNEVSVLKRKNAAGIRELTRELQSHKRQLVALSKASKTTPTTSVILSGSSRTSSNTSLNRAGALPEDSSSLSNGGVDSQSPSFHLSQQSANKLLVPDSHVLIEKIVNLQRQLAKKQEKLDFQDEHISTLLQEVKKKSKLIQHYVCKQETGVLSTSTMDANKPAVIKKVHDENERKISESGGIMSSLYSSKSNDASMTLELSLEINQKLQAVLEDTLLKNITLKENINTLGQEIAKMSTGQ